MDIDLITRFIRVGVVAGLFYSIISLLFCLIFRRWFLNSSIDTYLHYTWRVTISGFLLLTISFTSLGVLIAAVEYGMNISLSNNKCNM